MRARISAPIAIVDENPEWSARLIAELQQRRLPFEKIDHSNHAYDPRDRQRRYSVIVNRSSPSSHRRGHGSVLFYAEPLLNHYEALGIPVINPVAAYRFEKSKALQADLFERLGVRYPRTIVLNHPDQVLKGLDGFRFPVVVKPNIGGPAAAIAQAIALTRAASIDVGGVEYLVSRADGRIYFYDVNATSNFVADAVNVLGFDPFKPFVDFIERVALLGK